MRTNLAHKSSLLEADLIPNLALNVPFYYSHAAHFQAATCIRYLHSRQWQLLLPTGSMNQAIDIGALLWAGRWQKDVWRK